MLTLFCIEPVVATRKWIHQNAKKESTMRSYEVNLQIEINRRHPDNKCTTPKISQKRLKQCFFSANEIALVIHFNA